jgi:hypothetical protein
LAPRTRVKPSNTKVRPLPLTQHLTLQTVEDKYSAGVI